MAGRRLEGNTGRDGHQLVPFAAASSTERLATPFSTVSAMSTSAVWYVMCGVRRV